MMKGDSEEGAPEDKNIRNLKLHRYTNMESQE